jgi:hypothetical protein
MSWATYRLWCWGRIYILRFAYNPRLSYPALELAFNVVLYWVKNCLNPCADYSYLYCSTCTVVLVFYRLSCYWRVAYTSVNESFTCTMSADIWSCLDAKTDLSFFTLHTQYVSTINERTYRCSIERCLCLFKWAGIPSLLIDCSNWRLPCC